MSHWSSSTPTLLQLEGGVVVDGVGVHDQSIVGDDLGACIAGLLSTAGLHCGSKSLEATTTILASLLTICSRCRRSCWAGLSSAK